MGALEDLGSRFVTPLRDRLALAYGNGENQICMAGAPMKEILILPVFQMRKLKLRKAK